MAGIRSLAVRGIRSFGPEDEDEQRISFDRPLTLILGQNGCGKTTIIESLRYAITGQMPPGSRNECFVHDAKVNRSSEVLAQVKLKVINAKDKQLEISRSMKVTALPAKKSKFQTLDSFLSVFDDNGKPKDISSRCADLDFMMNEELGVSKAIINSVILCHQEDSCWPLDEGKKVKERFDEIFDADKYSDCFDRLRKIRKDYATNIKLLTQEVAYLTDQKEELDKKKLQVVNTETSISEAELKVAELASELKPVTEKIQNIEKLQRDLVSFETKKEKIKTRLEHSKTQQEELTKAIKDEFMGTTEELQEKITNYTSTSKANKKELDDSHKKIFNFNQDEEKTANSMAANEAKYNKWALLESQHQERIDSRNKMIVEAGKLVEIELETIESDDKAAEGAAALAARLSELDAALRAQKAEVEAEEKKLQAVINEARDALAAHKQKIVSKEGEITKIKKDITKTNKEINTANESKAKLEAVQQKVTAAETEYETVAAELNIEDCQKEINDSEKSVDESEKELETLEEKITKLQKQSSKLKEKDMVEEILRSKEKQLSVLKNKHRSALTELFGEMPEKNFAVTVNKLECEHRKEVDSIKKKIKDKQLESTRLESDRAHTRSLLASQRAELAAAQERVYAACGAQPYDVALAKVNLQVEKLQEEQNLLESSLFIIRKYKEQLAETSSCPVCNRGFDAETEVTELISDLTSKAVNVPSNLEKAREELQKASAKKDDMLALKSVNERLSVLRDTEIPKLETRLAEAETKIAEVAAATEELQTALAAPEQRLRTAKQVQGDMPLLDRYANEITTTVKSLDKILEQCAGFECELTLDEAAARQADLRQRLSALRAAAKAAQARLNAHNKRLAALMTQKNKLKEQMLNIQKKVQDLVNLEERLRTLEQSTARCQEELTELQDGVAPLDAAVQARQEEKNDAMAKLRAEIEVKQDYNKKFESAFDKVKAIAKEVKSHIDKNIPKQMQAITDANAKLMEKKMQVMKDRDEVTKRIDALKDELAKQEIYKRDLEDNLKLRKATAEAAACLAEVADIEARVAGVDTHSLGEKEALIVTQTRLFREKAEMDGSLKAHRQTLASLRKDLQHTINKNVESKYKEKYYDLHITRALDQDTKDYAVALEKCVMEFHKEKMQNINLIIREMWRKIYRGNDIDYIEIKTDSSMGADSDRRKYDYKVVQCKNGVEIDMRGRCSAGQKVLASLIIRLALAETFSSRFGILALDEPTTNLDEENVRSLCAALGEIVQERRRQRNFMFIVITHDREFIDSLAGVDKVSHYYEVSRNHDGKSRIKRVKFT